MALADRRTWIKAAFCGGLAVPVLAAQPAEATRIAEYLGFPRPFDGVVIGDPDQHLMVVEYFSPAATHSARWHKETFPKIKADLIDTGKVRWGLCELLTGPLSISFPALLIARKAGTNKYLSVIEAVFNAHDEIFRTGEPEPSLRRIAADFGIEGDAYDLCLQDWQMIVDVVDRSNATSDSGIAGVPTFMIGDVIIGEGSYVTFDMVAEAITKARSS